MMGVHPAVVANIYTYWVQKREVMGGPLLRCFQSFPLLGNWDRSGSSPDAIEDEDPEDLLRTFSKMQELRRDLERARIIADLVRRREKFKAERLRCVYRTADMLLEAPNEELPIDQYATLPNAAKGTVWSFTQSGTTVHDGLLPLNPTPVPIDAKGRKAYRKREREAVRRKKKKKKKKRKKKKVVPKSRKRKRNCREFRKWSTKEDYSLVEGVQIYGQESG